MPGAMPGGVGTHPELTGVQTVEDGRHQGTRQGHPHTESVKRSPGPGLVAILEQEYQAAAETGDHADEQNDDDGLE